MRTGDNVGGASKARKTLKSAIARAREALLAHQHADGHWCFEFEADCTIPAEYVLMMHYMDERDEALQERIARYIRSKQQTDDGWPLYPGGAMDLSCTVKAYYALKLAGDEPEAEHMRRAREAILATGGAARANVFTRIMLAQFRQIPWRGVPFMPVELILLPRWFPFHFLKVSYWSRTVMVPLLILISLRRQARNPTGIGVAELFTTPPEAERHWFKAPSLRGLILLWLERAARPCEAIIPWGFRRWAFRRCERWMVPRLNGEGGLGAIFPAMVNAYEALDALGYGPNHPYRKTAKRALELLLMDRGEMTYCQPCVSPVWDTGLAILALEQAGGARAEIGEALDWLADRQLLEAPADWQEYRPRLQGGGWAFQYRNDYYPDLDDTSAIGWAMYRADREKYAECIARAADWLAGMQSKNGGFAAFDADNTYYALNEIPFADHGALLDPPTEDVTGRCVAFFSLLGEPYRAERDRAINYLDKSQQPDGSWWGRWGCNHIYGTWSVLSALEMAGLPPEDERVRRAVVWLKSVQHEDGSFGETNDTYNLGEARAAPGTGPATPEQTAWALLALMAGGEAESEAVTRGIDWLLADQASDGLWHTEWFNAPGFPRVFYLRYHGYSAYFPLWALARYRNLTR
jgi:squalene-hopene/tetraprenyl-beta-curcumene cyclase